MVASRVDIIVIAVLHLIPMSFQEYSLIRVGSEASGGRASPSWSMARLSSCVRDDSNRFLSR